MNGLPLRQWVDITAMSNMSLYAMLANTGESQAVREYYVHDENGLLVKVTDPMGRKTHYAYDDGGNISAVLAPQQQPVHYVHFLGAVKRISTGSGKHTRVWLNTINERGEIVAAKDPAGLITRYTYHENGKTASISYPSGEQKRFEWDDVGRLTEESSTGALTQYHYDSVGRLISAGNPQANQEGRHAANVESFEYDPGGNRTFAACITAATILTMVVVRQVP